MYLARDSSIDMYISQVPTTPPCMIQEFTSHVAYQVQSIVACPLGRSSVEQAWIALLEIATPHIAYGRPLADQLSNS